ncbi:MAG: hypothetical protein AAF228_11435 [Pseudomonadota bacterium]
MSSVSVYSDNDGSVSVSSDQGDASVISTPSSFRENRFSLKRTGQRPYTFSGSEICTSTSHSVGPALWYELNVYRSHEGQYIVEIKMFNKNGKFKDRNSVFEVSSIEELSSFLEHYDPAGDISNNVSLEGDDMPLSLLALEGIALKIRIEEARNQFKDLAGELLYQLNSH